MMFLETAPAQSLAHHTVGLGESRLDSTLFQGFVEFGEEFDAGQREKFLVAVEPIAMLAREHAADFQ